MQINQVISIKCILFTGICGGYIVIHHAVDFLGDIECRLWHKTAPAAQSI